MTLRSKIKHVYMFILITHISINNINNQSFREYPKAGPLPEALAALLPTGVDIYSVGLSRSSRTKSVQEEVRSAVPRAVTKM